MNLYTHECVQKNFFYFFSLTKNLLSSTNRFYAEWHFLFKFKCNKFLSNFWNGFEHIFRQPEKKLEDVQKEIFFSVAVNSSWPFKLNVPLELWIVAFFGDFYGSFLLCSSWLVLSYSLRIVKVNGNLVFNVVEFIIVDVWSLMISEKYLWNAFWEA